MLDTLPFRGKYVLNGSDRPMSPNGWAKDRLDVELAEDWRFHNLRRGASPPALT